MGNLGTFRNIIMKTFSMELKYLAALALLMGTARAGAQNPGVLSQAMMFLLWLRCWVILSMRTSARQRNERTLAGSSRC